MAKDSSNDSTWRAIFGLLFLTCVLATVFRAGQRATAVRGEYAHLLTPAVEALAGNPVKVEDLAQIEQILERRNAEFREMLMRRGLTKEQIDGFRYGRYKLVREE